MKKKTIYAVSAAVLFILLMIGVKTIDVRIVGPLDATIGFAGINTFFRDLIGVNMFFYDLTDLFGYVAIAVCGLFGLIGLVQLIERKDIMKVDKQILALGALYVITIIFYIFFEIVIINYRPTLMPGSVELEASFPSSHTVLIIVVMLSATLIVDKYLKKKFAEPVKALCYVVAGITVMGRFVSGVHWFTDILGGIFLSLALLFAYEAALEYLNK